MYKNPARKKANLLITNIVRNTTLHDIFLRNPPKREGISRI